MSFGKTVNLGNSIIGVSILAMPYCFVRSGLILSILLVVISGFLTRLSCHFLLKSAFLSKRRSFELLVNDVLGSTGRLLVELGLIGFLLGTCVAYFIMIGDLAPKIVAELFDLKYNRNLRMIVVIMLSLFVALPLSLLKRVDSLTSLSLISMLLYSCLILKLLCETTDKFRVGEIAKDRLGTVTYWNLSGLLTTFPIFSMAMSCQTSLFEIFDNSVIVNDLESIRRDNQIIKRAIYMCSFVYITVGMLGYMAFHEQILYGNILLEFPPSFTTTLTKIGFIITLLMSFPLCLFPCRTSVHSLTIGKLQKTSFQQLSNTAPATTLVGMNLGNHYTSRDNNCDNEKNNNNHLSSNGNGARNYFKLYLNSSNGSVFSSNHKSDQVKYASLLEDCDDPSLDLEENQNNGCTYVSHIDPGPPSRLYITDFQFKILTVILIGSTVTLSLIFPHIEFILGIIGSTAGTTVCFILPAFTFIRIGEHSHMELLLARLLLLIGVMMLLFCTYSTIINASLASATE